MSHCAVMDACSTSVEYRSNRSEFHLMVLSSDRFFFSLAD
jgi:hypothetical protein